MNGLALYSGCGGLELGLHLALKKYRTVCAVERQAYAAASFLSWMEKTGMGACPVWDDVATFDPLPWRECVDIISAGFPCQPYSNAGKGLGELDPRDGWPHVIRVVRGIMPAVVFFENVPALLARGYDRVKRNLEGIGYTVAERIFSAAEVGAPHLRERLFILGILEIAKHDGCQEWHPERGWADPALLPSAGTLADATRIGWPQGRAERAFQWRQPEVAECGSRLANTGSMPVGETMGHSEGQPEWAGLRPRRTGRIRRGRSGDAGSEELGNALSARHEGQRNGRPTGDGRFAWPWPAGRGSEQYPWEEPRLVESGVGRAAYGLDTRNEQLLGLGNGVVPMAAAMAFVSLWREIVKR